MFDMQPVIRFLVLSLFACANALGQELVQGGSNSESADSPQPRVTEIGQGVYAMSLGYLNSVFVVGEEAVLVMDTYNPRFAAAQKREISRITDLPVKYVVRSGPDP